MAINSVSMHLQLSRSVLINLALLLSFLICYLEWGTDQSAFVFQIEYSLLSGGKDFQSFIHPLVFLPFIGQLLLLYSLFRKRTSRVVLLIGWALLSLLVAVILLAGVFALNVKIIGSTIPYISFSIWFFLNLKNTRYLRRTDATES